jgi:signal transduction histidine kinase
VASPATLMEKLRLLLVRERELGTLRQDYQAFRAWIEKVHGITLRLADHGDRDQVLAALVQSLVSDFAFEYAAAISETFHVSAGAAPETAADFGLLSRAVAEARATGQIDVTTPNIPLQASDINSARLGWLLAAPIHGAFEFVLLAGRSPRAAAFYAPPWDRDIDRFRHLRDAVVQVVAAVELRAALVAERNNLQVEVQRATAQMSAALAIAESARHAALDASQAKTNFLASMSHELRTPLNALIGYSELLLEDAEALGADNLIEGARSIQRAGSHLGAIVTDILDVSKIEARRVELSLETFELVPLLEHAMELVRPQAEKRKNQLALELPREPGKLHSDPVKLQQVLVNLLGNACKFTERGKITVRVQTGFSRTGVPGVAISIVDTGTGMSVDQLGQIFDPYRQVHADSPGAPKGTGLGLFIARRLSQLMGGDITVRSAPGQGSTFVIQLPREAPPLPP